MNEQCFAPLRFDTTTSVYEKVVTAYESHAFCQENGATLPIVNTTSIETHIARVLNKMLLVGVVHELCLLKFIAELFMGKS